MQGNQNSSQLGAEGTSKYFNIICQNIIGSDILVDPGRNRHGGMAEDQMFDDLENMLGGVAGGKGSKATRVGKGNGLVR